MSIGRRINTLERTLGDDTRCPRCNPRTGGVLDVRLVSGTCPVCGGPVDASGRGWRDATLIVADGPITDAARRCGGPGVKIVEAGIFDVI